MLSELKKITLEKKNEFESEIIPHWKILIAEHPFVKEIEKNLEIEYREWGVELYAEYYDGYDFCAVQFKICNHDMDLNVEDFEQKIKKEAEDLRKEKRKNKTKEKKIEKENIERWEREQLDRLKNKYESKTKNPKGTKKWKK